MQENDKRSREELYETSFLEYLIANKDTEVSIEDWAEGHGLDLAYLRETGERCGFAIPKGTPVKKQREDYTSSFEPKTTDTEITPIVRMEKLKAEEKERMLKEKAAAEPQEEMKPAPRKRGRPRKNPAPPERKKTLKEDGQPAIQQEAAPSFADCLAKAESVEKNGKLFLIASSEEEASVLEGQKERTIELVRRATGFEGDVVITAGRECGQEEDTAARPQEEKTLKEEGGKEMPEAKDRKPSFLMMDGKAVLEYDGFHMEVSVDVSNSGDIKGKLDLLYSSLERFTAIAGGN